MRTAEIFGLEGIPLIKVNDDLGQIIVDSLLKEGLLPEEGDILVITHTIVSKAEGRTVDLTNVKPKEEAIHLAEKINKDPRLIEIILRESSDIIRIRRGLIITRHNLGYICANAGVDSSNSGHKSSEHVILLPEDPDRSARMIRDCIYQKFRKSVAVIIIDTQGRPFREGAVGVALGFSGLMPLKSFIGSKDLNDYILKSSIEGFADELASAATLIMGQSNEGIPVVLIRGLDYQEGEASLSTMIRDPENDVFI